MHTSAWADLDDKQRSGKLAMKCGAVMTNRPDGAD
jgi:hypothetical protein